MRYSDRIEVITSVLVDGDMGPEKRDKSLGLLKCHVSGMSTALNIGVFGQYRSDAVAVHFKGRLDGVAYLVINGIKRKPDAVFKAIRNTIVVVSSV